MTRALRWVALGALGVDAIFLVSIILALAITYNAETTIVILLLVMWVLWLSVLVVALIAAGRRHAVRWLITFVVLAVICITSTALIVLQLGYQPSSLAVYEVVFDLLRLFLGDNYTVFSLLLPVLFATYLLPMPVAALWYRRRLTAGVEPPSARA